jgi:hypothetical protein
MRERLPSLLVARIVDADETRRGDSRLGYGLGGLTRSNGGSPVLTRIRMLDDPSLEPYPRYSILLLMVL